MVSSLPVIGSLNLITGGLACPLWARSSLAAVQRSEFELNSRSSQSRYAEKSIISAGWLNDRAFGGLNQSSEEIGGNDGSEPIVLNAALGAKVRFVSRRLC